MKDSTKTSRIREIFFQKAIKESLESSEKLLDVYFDIPEAYTLIESRESSKVSRKIFVYSMYLSGNFFTISRVSEDFYPNHFECPMKILKRSTQEDFSGWRKKCFEVHKERLLKARERLRRKHQKTAGL